MPDHCTKEAELATIDQKIIGLKEDTTRHGVTVGKIFVQLKELNDKMGKLQTATEVLWYKTGIWGLLGGAIPVAIGLLILLLKNKL